MSNLVSVHELSEILGVKASWLYSRTRTKEIPHFKLGKYVKFDVDEVFLWLKKKNQEVQHA